MRMLAYALLPELSQDQLGPGSSARASRLRILTTSVKASLQAFNRPDISLPSMPTPRVVQVQSG